MKGQIGRILHARSHGLYSAIRRSARGRIPGARAILEAVLWTVLVAMSMVALSLAQQTARLQKELALHQVQKIALQDSNACRQRGFAVGTHGHLLCMMDRKEARAEKAAPPVEPMSLP